MVRSWILPVSFRIIYMDCLWKSQEILFQKILKGFIWSPNEVRRCLKCEVFCKPFSEWKRERSRSSSRFGILEFANPDPFPDSSGSPLKISEGWETFFSLLFHSYFSEFSSFQMTLKQIRDNILGQRDCWILLFWSDRLRVGWFQSEDSI